METDGRVPERSPKAFISATDSGIRSFAGKESVSMVPSIPEPVRPRGGPVPVALRPHVAEHLLQGETAVLGHVY